MTKSIVQIVAACPAAVAGIPDEAVALFVIASFLIGFVLGALFGHSR